MMLTKARGYFMKKIILSLLVLPNMVWAQAKSEDVQSIDAIIGALYDVISGPKERKRDWQRFYSLFDDDARLIFAANDTASGFQTRTPQGYMEIAEVSFANNDFYETEISRDTERFGNIAHVFSTYAGRRSPDGEPFLRGINSIQLAHKNGRWFIETIFWQAETEEFSLPNKYLD